MKSPVLPGAWCNSYGSARTSVAWCGLNKSRKEIPTNFPNDKNFPDHYVGLPNFGGAWLQKRLHWEVNRSFKESEASPRFRVSIVTLAKPAWPVLLLFSFPIPPSKRSTRNMIGRRSVTVLSLACGDIAHRCSCVLCVILAHCTFKRNRERRFTTIHCVFLRCSAWKTCQIVACAQLLLRPCRWYTYGFVVKFWTCSFSSH